jgi:hypothetical protein
MYCCRVNKKGTANALLSTKKNFTGAMNHILALPLAVLSKIEKQQQCDPKRMEILCPFHFYNKNNVPLMPTSSWQ